MKTKKSLFLAAICAAATSFSAAQALPFLGTFLGTQNNGGCSFLVQNATNTTLLAYTSGGTVSISPGHNFTFPSSHCYGRSAFFTQVGHGVVVTGNPSSMAPGTYVVRFSGVFRSSLPLKSCFYGGTNGIVQIKGVNYCVPA